MQRLKEDLDSVWARVWAASADRELLLRKVSLKRKKKTKWQNPLRIVKPEPLREPVLVRERARAAASAAVREPVRAAVSAAARAVLAE